MSRYTPISLPEVQDLLKAEKGWKIESTGNEIVFQFPMSTAPHIVVKVYSTLRRNDQLCRGNGQDAIRVCAVDTVHKCGWISSRRVLRVAGWKQNLTNAVMDIFKQSQGRLKLLKELRK